MTIDDVFEADMIHAYIETMFGIDRIRDAAAYKSRFAKTLTQLRELFSLYGTHGKPNNMSTTEYWLGHL